jgi:hypothetical protein
LSHHLKQKIKTQKMRQLQTILLTLFICAMVVSCSKNNEDIKPPYVVEGLYSGKIGTGSATPSGQYALSLKSDGTIARISQNGDTTATGTWQLNGTAFSASYASVVNTTTVEVTGTLDKEAKKISGNWVNNSGTAGTYVITKQ